MLRGHPKGLYPLFFIEMWERLAFYTMLGILLLYTTDAERGGLGLSSQEGNQIYGLYLAFVYFTPFIGGMVADRFLGYRKSVILGGLMMAAGLFLMSTPGRVPFTAGIIGLIIGNGFFKPNISVMVGNLYGPGDVKRDSGFNIFYMGINIGAFVANIMAASVRNEYGWLWTFRIAGFGLLIGLVILLFNWKLLERADRTPEISPDDTGFREVILKILLPAFGVGIAGYFLARTYASDGPVPPAVCGFLVGMIPVIVFFVRLGVTAKPEEKPGLLALLPVYVAGATFFMVLHLNGSAMTQWARDNTDRQEVWTWSKVEQEAFPRYYFNAAEDVPRPDPLSLFAVEMTSQARMYGQQRMDESTVGAIVAAGEGVLTAVEFPEDQEAEEAWTDRQKQVFRRATDIYADGDVSVDEGTDSHGVTTVTVTVTEGANALRKVSFVRQREGGQLAVYVVDRAAFDRLYDGYRERFGKDPQTLAEGEFLPVANSELYQSFNPLFVVLFTPLFVAFFAFLLNRGRGVTTARKIFLGMVFLTIALLVMALAGVLSDGGTAKVSSMWLVGFYAILTIGELCLSPMGLSLVTKLTPKRLVGLAMGGWFLATAFGNNFAGFFGGIQAGMEPATFYLVLAGIAAITALFIFLLLPRLDAAIKRYGA